jgi:hypothetical protein
MSNPFIRIALPNRPPEQIDAMSIDSGGGYGMLTQMGSLENYDLEGVRTLIESVPGYGFYVFLINDTKKLKRELKASSLEQKYKDAQIGNEEFKSYMIKKLDPRREKLNRDDNKVYMICIAQMDWSTLPAGNELFSSELVEALKHISYGVSSGGGKRHKKSYKRNSNKRTKRSKKIRKTRRYKK